MALFGHTGVAKDTWLSAMSRSLAHRGQTLTANSLGGHNVETGNDDADAVTVAWSGQFRTGVPSLLAAYRADGIDFVKRLQGQYVIAIRDGKSLYLVRDGAGARTAYFGKVGSQWCVAAEPKGIWGLPGFSKRIRHAAIAQYLTYSFIPGTGTMLEDLWEVPPGHYVHLQQHHEPKLVRHFK